MNKLLIASVVTLATTMFLSVGHAGNSNNKDGHGNGHSHSKNSKRRQRHKRNRNSAVVSYRIDPASCEVTINSTKRLSKIVLTDSSGKTLKQWRKIKGKSFSNFGMYEALLADGNLYVKSGNNSKRSRGFGAEIGDDFRVDLEACLSTPPLAGCPFEAQIDEFRDAAGGNANLDVFDNTLSCELYFNTQEFSIFNNADGTGYVGAKYFRDTCTAIGNPDTSDQCTDFVNGTLNAEEAQACVDHIALCTTSITD